MAMTGKLENEGLAAALLRLAQDAKSGVLHVRRGKEDIDVHLVRGRVERALPAGEAWGDRAPEVLVQAGLVNEAQIDHALAVQKRTLRPLGDVLAGEGLVERETFRRVHLLRTSDALQRMLRWTEGSFSFEEQDVDAGHDVGATLKAADIVADARRAKETWPRVERLLPSLDVSLSVSEEGACRDLSEKERRILSLLQDAPDVRSVIQRSMMGELATCEVLADLVEKGAASPEAGRRKRPALRLRPRLKELSGALAHVGVQSAVGLLVLAGIGALAYLAMGSRAEVEAISPSAEVGALEAHARARVETAIDVWRLEKGSNPDSLEDMVAGGLLSSRDLTFPHGRQWFYRVAEGEPKGYLLLRPIP